MKPDRLHGCDAKLLHEGYEQLRRDALGTSVAEGMKGKGLVLVLRHGMLAWIFAWSECAVVDNENENGYEETDRYLMPEDIRYQTAVLLATMAVHVRQEARSI
jgi:hypothetical protein